MGPCLCCQLPQLRFHPAPPEPRASPSCPSGFNNGIPFPDMSPVRKKKGNADGFTQQTALSQLQGSRGLRWEHEQLRGRCIAPQSTILGGCEGCPRGWVPREGDTRWQRGELPVPMVRGPRGAPARQMWGLNPSGAFCRGDRRRWPRGGVHNSRQPKASCC